MKTSVILTLIGIAIVEVSFAQTSKGTWVAGGNLRAEFSKYTVPAPQPFDTKYRRIDLMPSVGYFVNDGLAIGLGIPFNYTGTSFSGSTSSYVTILAGPNMRYYIPFGKWAAFPELGYYFGSDINKEPPVIVSGVVVSPGSRSTTARSSLQLGAGTTYFITNKIGVEAVVYFERVSFGDSGTEKTKISSLLINGGLKVYLARQ